MCTQYKIHNSSVLIASNYCTSCSGIGLQQECACRVVARFIGCCLLLVQLQEAFNEFQGLEDRITYVATKVVHLGDQLESSNNRRVRAIEAQNLMKILAEFEHKAKPSLPVFTDPARVSPLLM